MKSSESLYFPVRELRYHVRAWGPADAPPLIMLHGWMDTSTSFQFTVDALKQDWNVLAPDWRGGVLGVVVSDGEIAVGDEVRIL